MTAKRLPNGHKPFDRYVRTVHAAVAAAPATASAAIAEKATNPIARPDVGAAMLSRKVAPTMLGGTLYGTHVGAPVDASGFPVAQLALEPAKSPGYGTNFDPFVNAFGAADARNAHRIL